MSWRCQRALTVNRIDKSNCTVISLKGDGDCPWNARHDQSEMEMVTAPKMLPLFVGHFPSSEWNLSKLNRTPAWIHKWHRAWDDAEVGSDLVHLRFIWRIMFSFWEEKCSGEKKLPSDCNTQVIGIWPEIRSYENSPSKASHTPVYAFGLTFSCLPFSGFQRSG